MRCHLTFYLFFGILFSVFAEKITIFNTTDLHGSLVNDYKGAGGILRVFDSLSKAKAQAEKQGKVMLIDCGDVFQGSPEVAADHGKDLVFRMNNMGYNVFVPGNHDFELFPSDFAKRVSEMKCAVLCGNVKTSNGMFSEWRLFNIGNARIAVIGLTNSNNRRWIYGYSARGYMSEGYLSALERIIPQVMKAKPHLIILAIHSGRFVAKRFNDGESVARIAAKYPQIGLILGGHSHEVVSGERIGPHSWYVQAGAHAKGYAVIDCEFSPEDDKITFMTSRYVSVTQKDGQAAAVKFLKDRRRKVRYLTRNFNPKPKIKQNIYMAELSARAMRDISGAELALAAGSHFFKYPVVTSDNVFQMCPFENTVVKAYITPAQCRAIMLEQEKMAGKTNRRQYIFGVRFDENGQLRLPDGSCWIKGRKSIAVNSFIAASGGMYFPELAAIISSPESQAVETWKLIRAALENLFAEGRF